MTQRGNTSVPAWRSTPFSSTQHRLKPAVINPLDKVGLPSKGDNSLLDLELQESYFVHIQERCQKIRAQTKAKDNITDLTNSLSRLQIQQQVTGVKDHRHEVVLMSMRKLREGIIASARVDQFAVDVYKFIIRTAISWQAWEAYQPALLWLLHRMHPRNPLPASDLQEFVSYRVLDLACRLSEYGLAYPVRLEWRLNDPLVDKVLTALVRNNSRLFWKCAETAGELQRCLIAMAEPRMRSGAVKCLTKTYFTVDNAFVRSCTGKTGDELIRSNTVDWTMEGETVTVRKIKGR